MIDLIKILEDKNLSNQAKVLYVYLNATLKEDDKYIYSVTFSKKLGWKIWQVKAKLIELQEKNILTFSDEKGDFKQWKFNWNRKDLT
jgi:hypothetical protein